MATTFLKPLHAGKGRSIAQALERSTDYVKNPDKTANGEWISAYQCNPSIVDAEFLFSKRQYEAQTGKTHNRKSDRTIVRDYGIDGFVSLIELPEYLKSEEDERIPSRYSPYDCSGAAFTQWYKIIKRRGRYFAYHSVGIDI
ncbi:MAG: hypothetical protein LUC30_08215 [Clostridiales bacterium]|nr:hypothetical protein [Clostridiales bacterium]